MKSSSRHVGSVAASRGRLGRLLASTRLPAASGTVVVIGTYPSRGLGRDVEPVAEELARPVRIRSLVAAHTGQERRQPVDTPELLEPAGEERDPEPAAGGMIAEGPDHRPRGGVLHR